MFNCGRQSVLLCATVLRHNTEHAACNIMHDTVLHVTLLYSQGSMAYTLRTPQVSGNFSAEASKETGGTGRGPAKDGKRGETGKNRKGSSLLRVLRLMGDVFFTGIVFLECRNRMAS